MKKKRPAAPMQALAKIRRLWQMGDLFHMTSRFPHADKAPRLDRLAGILERGLIAPGRCDQGTVLPNIRVEICGAAVPYDHLVFLHRMCPWSRLYIAPEPGRFSVLVDPAHPVLTPQQFGANWAILCPDEVYVLGHVPRESLTGIVVHPADADGVIDAFIDDFHHLAIPLYHYDGAVAWPPVSAKQ